MDTGKAFVAADDTVVGDQDGFRNTVRFVTIVTFFLEILFFLSSSKL